MLTCVVVLELVQPGSVQHMGSNVHALIRGVVTAPEFGTPREADDGAVFADVFGYFTLLMMQPTAMTACVVRPPPRCPTLRALFKARAHPVCRAYCPWCRTQVRVLGGRVGSHHRPLAPGAR